MTFECGKMVDGACGKMVDGESTNLQAVNIKIAIVMP